MSTSKAGGRLRIGAVLERLREEFPDVSISKIRFLEGQGLVEPERTASGYRTFSEADVERLRYVLTAQRDRFWPLKVIRDNLDALDRGLTPPDPGDGTRPQPPAPAADPDVPSARDLRAATRPGVRLTRAELAAASGLEAEALEALLDAGLLHPDADGHHDEADLQVAHAAAGLTAYGIEPRHLRAFRTAADREVGLVERALVVSRRPDDMSGEHAAQVAHLCLMLHAALLKGGLARGAAATR